MEVQIAVSARLVNEKGERIRRIKSNFVGKFLNTVSMKQNGKMAYTPEFVESLKDGQVFVFGSNLIGNH